MAKRVAALAKGFDRELADFPPELRLREWMARVEAVIFASPIPVGREMLARVIGADCNLDLLIEDIREELRTRPYELVAVAGGWQHRTRSSLADAIRASGAAPPARAELSQHETRVLMAIAYFQPVTRGELSKIFGRDISRDTIAALRGDGLIAAGPRSPQPGAPYTYITTNAFLAHYGFTSLRDLPDMEKLEEAGLLTKDALLPEGRDAFGEMLGGASDDGHHDGDDVGDAVNLGLDGFLNREP
jgi:segregation and condensation protein B